MIAAGASGLYPEDFEAGQRYESRETYALTQDRAVEFTWEFGSQPFHTDLEAAKDSFFKGLAVSGWMTRTIRLLTRSLDIAGGIIGAGVETAWPSPARPSWCFVPPAKLWTTREFHSNKKEIKTVSAPLYFSNAS
jgi:acyl dehydratase